MKVKVYLEKFFNPEGKLINQNGFLLTLNAEFLLNLYKDPEFDESKDNNGKLFEKYLTDIREKFADISDELDENLNEGLWRYFFANYIVVSRDELFKTYARNKFIANKRKIMERESTLEIPEALITKACTDAYNEYMQSESKRKGNLSRVNKFLIDLCKSFRLRADKLNKEQLNQKIEKVKSKTSDKDQLDYLDEVKMLLTIFIKYRDESRNKES